MSAESEYDLHARLRTEVVAEIADKFGVNESPDLDPQEPIAYWHLLAGRCNHVATEVGGECGHPDLGTWVPLYMAPPAAPVPPAPTPKDPQP